MDKAGDLSWTRAMVKRWDHGSREGVFELRREGREGERHGGHGNSRCKGPGAGAHLVPKGTARTQVGGAPDLAQRHLLWASGTWPSWWKPVIHLSK